MKMSNLEAAVDRTRALGHPARLRALAMLRTGELCVCQITEVLQLAQSTVSTHLRELKRARLITERKDGRWVYFGLSADPDARSWIDVALKSLEGDPQLEADDRLVGELRRFPVADLCRLGYEGAKARSKASG
jgi:DNA-binding transcriptional ArsR family regulator